MEEIVEGPTARQMATLKGPNLHDQYPLIFMGQVWFLCSLKEASALCYILMTPTFTSTALTSRFTCVAASSTPPMVNLKISQTCLPKTGFLIFTNPVLPKMSTSSSRSLKFTFNTSFLKLHINQSTNSSLYLWKSPESDYLSSYPPLLFQYKPVLVYS